MDINSNLALLIGLPIQFLAIFLIIFYLLDDKITKRDVIPIILLTFLPTIFIFLIIGPLASFYLLLSLVIFFKRKFNNNFFILHILFSFIMSVITDHIASIISINYFSNISSELLFFILRGILFCLLLAISAYIYKQVIIYFTLKNIFSKRVFYLFASVIFLTFLFFYLNIAMMRDYSSYEAIQLNLWIFSIYLVLILAIATALVYLSIKQYKIKTKEKEQENFSNYLQLLEQTNEDTRKFKHDYINILMSLRYYIEKEDIQALKTYFAETILPTQQKEIDNTKMLDELNKLKVDGLKGLLTTKFIHAQENGIPIHLEVSEEISRIQLDIIELNRVLGILLDNAIEASKRVDNALICIAFIKFEYSTMIVILNRIQEDLQLSVQDVFQKGFSTKGENRGLGLSILKEIINANNHVVLNTKIDTHYFTQELEIQQEENI